MHSFAPPGVPVVGRGLGALAAVAVTAKAPGVLGRLVLLDTLPGSLTPTWPDDSWTEADDDTLWQQLAAAPDPVLVRTEGGTALDAALTDRFRAEVPNGETVSAGSDPAALAAVLRELLP
ncbi:hypothetical protein [Streptacidiphilus sp. PAMC 29251]